MQSTYSSIVYCLVVISLFYSIVQPCRKKYMNIIESVIYCSAGLMLLGLGSDHSYYKHSRIGGYFTLYLSLLLLVLPSLLLILFSLIAKILMCLGSNMNAHRVKGIFCRRGQTKCNDSLTETPDRLEHPLEYEVIP